MACPDEITSCDEMKLGDSQLFRKMLRKVGDCLGINVMVQPASQIPANSATDKQYFTGADNTATINAFQAWKSLNPAVKIIEIVHMTGNDGVTGLLVIHTI